MIHKKLYITSDVLFNRLPIEHGRFWGIERDDRICDICPCWFIGEEFHCLFECSFYINREKKTAGTP